MNLAQPIVVGAIYWATTKSDIPHPHVVLSVDGDKVTVCQITTNMNKAQLPGNFILRPGEAGLEKQSIVEVTKQATIEVSELGGFIGALSPQRVQQVKQGAAFVAKSFER